MGRNRRKRYCFQGKREGAKRPLLSFNIECSNQSRNDVSRVIAKVLQRSCQSSAEKFAIYTCEVCQTDASILPSGLQGKRIHLLYTFVITILLPPKHNIFQKRLTLQSTYNFFVYLCWRKRFCQALRTLS